MATLREIRRRIAGVKSTQKITKAMKMVAAAKLRRAQEAVLAARPYERKMKDLLQRLASETDFTANPLFVRRPVRKAAVIMITADRGLCGAFNANVIRTSLAHLQTAYGDLLASGNAKLICIGRKGADFVQKGGYPILSRHVGIYADLNFGHAREIAEEVVRGYQSGELDRVDIIYNDFKSIIHQRVVTATYLPVSREEGEGMQSGSGVAGGGRTMEGRSRWLDSIYEPSREEILAALIPQYLNFEIWHKLLESNASEQGARMTAMDNATTNASDLIRELQLGYNKARQSSITKELLEIVSGAEALRTSG